MARFGNEEGIGLSVRSPEEEEVPEGEAWSGLRARLAKNNYSSESLVKESESNVSEDEYINKE